MVDDAGDRPDRFRWTEVKDLIRDIFLAIDARDGRLVDANAAAERAYGYARAQLLALTVFDLRSAAPDAIAEQMAAADQAGLLFETVHRRADGTTFPVEVSTRGETIGDRRVLVSLIRDITDRRRAEQERERLLAATQQALASRDEFLMVASHELRTPISVIGLQAHQLRRMVDRGEGADRLRGATDAALRQIARLEELVTVLLDVTRIAGGHLELERGPVEVRALVADVLHRLADEAHAAGSEISTTVDDLTARWDRVRIEQALTNLLGNAIKYGEGRPISLSVRAVGDAVVAIEVRDRGIGLSADDRGRIFEKFVRAAPLAHYGGLGLGLYITRQIVEAHGGTIEATGEPGLGATFTIALPR